MKLRFYRKQFPNTYTDPKYYVRGEIVGAETDYENPYVKYLADAYCIDLYQIEDCKRQLEDIKKVMRGEQKSAGVFGLNAFDGTVYIDRVEIEHQQFAGHPDWPMWTCPLPVFMQALKGWMEFLKLPKSAESSLVVELDV